MKLPKKIKILDHEYRIIYLKKPSDVDVFKRESLWGQLDYWTRTIRIYTDGRSETDIHHTIWHEILHGICGQLKLDTINNDEKAIDLLATGINSILIDNVKGFSFK